MTDILRDDDFDSNKIPDKWDYFEAMDRCSMIMSHICGALTNHHGLHKDEAEKAQLAVDLIMDIYRACGRNFDFCQENENK